MNTPWVLNNLTCVGPWGTAEANATQLRGGFAPGYNQLDLVLYDSPVSHLMLRNQAVQVYLQANATGNNCLFSGYVRAARMLLGGSDEYAIYCEVDGQECSADVDFVGSPLVPDPMGWVCNFNEGGRPNKSPTADEFYWGPGATYWTGASAIRKIRNAYALRSSWTFTDAQLTAVSALATVLKPYDARGERILAAYCEILKRCGCRLVFRYANPAGCQPVIIDEAGYGTFWVQYRPTVPDQDNEIYEISTAYDMRKATPVMYAIAGRDLVETVYATNGADPLLTLQASSDQDFYKEAVVNVQNYTAHGISYSLAAGSRPLPLQSQLLSRKKAVAGTYYTAAEVTADPNIGEAVNMRETLALWDATANDWRRISGGAQFQPTADSNVILRLKKEISIIRDTAGKTKKVDLSTLGSIQIRFTGVTQVHYNQVVTLSSYATAGVAENTGMLNLEQYHQGNRYQTILPGATPLAWISAAANNEYYPDLTTQIQLAAAAAYAQRGRQISVVDFTLPFWPQEVPLGALLVVNPAPIGGGLSGREIVNEYSWNLGEVEVRVKAGDSFDLQDDGLNSKDLAKILSELRKLEANKR